MMVIIVKKIQGEFGPVKVVDFFQSAEEILGGAKSICDTGFMDNIDSIIACLENEAPEIEIEEEIRQKAERSIEAMVAVK